MQQYDHIKTKEIIATQQHIFNNGEEEKISVIKNEMEQYLPNFMIPETFIKMKEFPSTINGKIDTKSLPMIMR